jgi:thiamine-monophosphate kinase
LNSEFSRECAITERLSALAKIPAGSAVVLGIGDDCAIYRPRGSAKDLLFTTDLLIEDVHFTRHSHKASDAGRKALTRSLSDIAAMGGTPRFCLVSLSAPKWADPKWLGEFFRAVTAVANATGAPLIGGDLARGDTLACDVTVCGDVPRGRALLRSGARPGDQIYVSGALGGSALGLATGPNKSRAWKRHLRPEPRLALGTFLRHELKARSAMDLSDGLSLDLHRLCLASGVAAVLDHDPPCFPGATLEHALHGGEDYELLFTVRPNTSVPRRFGNLPLTRIGTILRGKAGDVRYRGKPLPALGYDHFSNR